MILLKKLATFNFILLAVLVLHNCLQAQDLATIFEARDYINNGRLRYRFFSPDGHTDASKKFPLVIYLHGSGKRGDNNEAQLGMAAVGKLYASQSKHPCYILAPQCPSYEEYEITTNKKSDGLLGHGVLSNSNLNQWVEMTIPIGKLYAGACTHFTFHAYLQKNPPATTVRIRNVRLRKTNTTNAVASVAFSSTAMKVYPENTPKPYLPSLPNATILDNGAGVSCAMNVQGRHGFSIPFAATVTSDMELVLETNINSLASQRFVCVNITSSLNYNQQRWSLDWGLSPSAPGARYGAEPNKPLGLVLKLAQELVRTIANIDTNRIYIGGQSMGGFGTWESIIRQPNFFAAAAPSAGGGDTTRAAAIKDVSIWAAHAVNDGIVNSRWTKAMDIALTAAGATDFTVTYYNSSPATTIDGNSHMIDNHFWNDALVDWLFSKSNDKFFTSVSHHELIIARNKPGFSKKSNAEHYSLLGRKVPAVYLHSRPNRIGLKRADNEAGRISLSIR